MLQEKLGEFGLSVEDLVGLTSDGAATMVACGRLMEVIHQLCLGKLYVIYICKFCCDRLHVHCIIMSQFWNTSLLKPTCQRDCPASSKGGVKNSTGTY